MDNIELEIKSMFKFLESLENTKNNINTSDVFDDKYYSDSLNNANKINEKTFNELFESIKSYKVNHEQNLLENIKTKVVNKEFEKINQNQTTDYLKKDLSNLFDILKTTDKIKENNILKINQEIDKEIQTHGFEFFLKKNDLEDYYLTSSKRKLSNTIYHIRSFYEEKIEKTKEEIYLLKEKYLLNIVSQKLNELGIGVKDFKINTYEKSLEYRSGDYNNNSWEYSEDLIKHYINVIIDNNIIQLSEPFENLDYIEINDDGAKNSSKYIQDNFKIIPTKIEIENILENNIIKIKEEIVNKQNEELFNKQQEILKNEEMVNKQNELKKQEENKFNDFKQEDKNINEIVKAIELYNESKNEILNNKDLPDDRKESLINKLKDQIFQEYGIDLNQKEKSQEIKKENIEDEDSTPKTPNIGE